MRVLIAEELPALNKGETAILMGLLESLKKSNASEIVLVTGRKDIDEPRYSELLRLVSRQHSSTGPDPGKGYVIKSLVSYALLAIFGRRAISFTESDERSWWSYLLNTDVIVIGHDNSMANGMSVDAYGIILLAKLRRKMLVYYAGSFGPFRSKSKARFARIALNAGNLVTLREAASYNYLKTIGVTNPNMFVTADLAFLARPASENEVTAVLNTENVFLEGSWVGINASSIISKLAFSRIASQEAKYEEFCRVFARVADAVVEKFGSQVLFVPHVFGATKKNDDRLTLRHIYEMAHRKEAMAVISGEYSPAVLKGIIGRLDLFMGCRTHSMIAATAMGVPTIALSSKGPEFMKTNGIIGDMMKLRDMLVFVEDLDFEGLFLKIEQAWAARDQIRDRLRENSQILQDAAAQNGLLFEKAWSEHTR